MKIAKKYNILLACLVIVAVILIILVGTNYWSNINTCPYTYVELGTFIPDTANAGYAICSTSLPYKNILSYINLTLGLSTPLPSSATNSNIITINCEVNYSVDKSRGGQVTIYNNNDYKTFSTPAGNTFITFSDDTCKTMAGLIYNQSINYGSDVTVQKGKLVADTSLSLQISLDGKIITPTIIGYCLLI
jgi:hypothetical protein